MIWIGTSGYNYPEWKGDVLSGEVSSAAKMPPYYAARFSTVEINCTFYRLPNEEWSPAGPPRRRPFQLTLKAPSASRTIAASRTARHWLQSFCRSRARWRQAWRAAVPARADVQEDLDLFDAFLTDLPPGARAAFEFRARVLVRRRGVRAAACAESGAVHRRQRERRRRSLPRRPDGYFRLRDEGYTTDAHAGVGATPSGHTRARGATPSCTSSTRRRGRAPIRECSKERARGIAVVSPVEWCRPGLFGSEPTLVR